MRVFFITFRSVTLAQRGELILDRAGYRCSVQRTPKWMEQQGCGYCLRLKVSDIGPCAALLRQNHVEYRKVYLQHSDGGVEEVAP